MTCFQNTLEYRTDKILKAISLHLHLRGRHCNLKNAKDIVSILAHISLYLALNKHRNKLKLAARITS